MSSNLKISVLDLMPHRPDQSQHQTMLNTIDAARAAESYGYERFWVAEHHNAGSLLSSATVVVMAEIAAATERIRVGSGGIMLPNHAPYVAAVIGSVPGARPTPRSIRPGWNALRVPNCSATT